MSLTDADTQHLTVLGLSTSGEEDALVGLLAAAKCSSGRDRRSGTHHEDATSESSKPPQGAPPREGAKVQTVSMQQLPKRGAADGECSKRRRDSTKPSPRQATGRFAAVPPNTKLLRTESVPQVPQDTAFQADQVCDDADTLPPLRELVHSKLVRPLTEVLHVTSLTRIQKLSWLPMMDKARDILIRSETGSGKTLAYGLPLLHQLLCECDTHPIKRQDGTIIIILCPTRELVVQVADVFAALTRCALFLTVGGIHGGENRHKEKARLRKGIPVLITTPGRLLDHLKTTSSFHVERMQAIVLDEADRLLDMGFEETIREIMELLLVKAGGSAPVTGGRQHTLQQGAQCMKRVLVSATITAGVERLSHFALRRNVARVGETEDTFSVPSSLRQHYVVVPTKHRLSTLIGFLRSQLDAGARRVIVFVSTADSAEFHYYLLSRLKSPFAGMRNGGRREEEETPQPPRAHRYSLKKRIEEANKHVHDSSEAVVTFDNDSDDGGETDVLREANAMLDVNIFKLHGNMSQVDRASVFHAFKHASGGTNRSEKGVLFCTDVAARGLDMPKVEWIVHYDPPTDETCYIHRIGRTARIGNIGDSILFLMPHEAQYAAYLSNFITRERLKSTPAADDVHAAAMEERKYELFLFYLTKLDPKARHMWAQSTATVERAISRLVMKRDESVGNFSVKETTPSDDLTRLALFAYQSYIRAYSGRSKEMKRLFFDYNALHLGHVAQSFGLDKKPREVQMQIQSIIQEDRKVARETSFLDTAEDDARPRRRLRVEVRHDDRYRSMIVQKQRKLTRDWYEKKRQQAPPQHRALQFTEFDA